MIEAMREVFPANPKRPLTAIVRLSIDLNRMIRKQCGCAALRLTNDRERKRRGQTAADFRRASQSEMTQPEGLPPQAPRLPEQSEFSSSSDRDADHRVLPRNSAKQMVCVK